MLNKIRSMDAKLKYSASSVMSVLLVLLFHLVHYLAAPLLLGAIGLESRHRGLHGGSPLMNQLATVALILNFAGIYFSLRQLYLAWKEKNRTRHTYLCSAVSLGALLIGVAMVVYA